MYGTVPVPGTFSLLVSVWCQVSKDLGHRTQRLVQLRRFNMIAHRTAVASIVAFGVVTTVNANENGLALSPPMGWRSWNLYGHNVDQELIEIVG